MMSPQKQKAIAAKLRELADLFDSEEVTAFGGGTGNGPPDPPGGGTGNGPPGDGG